MTATILNRPDCGGGSAERRAAHLQRQLERDAVVALDALAVLVAQRQLAERVRAAVLDRQLEEFDLRGGEATK